MSDRETAERLVREIRQTMRTGHFTVGLVEARDLIAAALAAEREACCAKLKDAAERLPQESSNAVWACISAISACGSRDDG